MNKFRWNESVNIPIGECSHRPSKLFFELGVQLLRISYAAKFSLIIFVGFLGCKKQMPIDERTAASGLSENTYPTNTPTPTVDPNPTTLPVDPNPTTDPTIPVTPTTVAQLAADMKLCNDKGLLYLMRTTTGNCLPEVKLAPVCTYDFVKAGMLVLGFNEAQWTEIKKSIDDGPVKAGAVLDQCGLIGESGVLVTHAIYQPGTKIVLGHYRNIFCADKTGTKPGVADCNRLSTEFFTTSN